jgi:DNA-binding PadR family transcriptional regulator
MPPLRKSSLDERATRLLPLTPAVTQILLSLSTEDRHGLGIAADIKAFTDGATVLGPGTLYGTIKRMLDAQLVEDLDNPGGAGDDPRRRYYRITALGRRVLELETERLAALVGTAHRRRAFTRP